MALGITVAILDLKKKRYSQQASKRAIKVMIRFQKPQNHNTTNRFRILKKEQRERKPTPAVHGLDLLEHLPLYKTRVSTERTAAFASSTHTENASDILKRIGNLKRRLTVKAEGTVWQIQLVG